MVKTVTKRRAFNTDRALLDLLQHGNKSRFLFLSYRIIRSFYFYIIFMIRKTRDIKNKTETLLQPLLVLEPYITILRNSYRRRSRREGD